MPTVRGPRHSRRRPERRRSRRSESTSGPMRAAALSRRNPWTSTWRRHAATREQQEAIAAALQAELAGNERLSTVRARR